MNRTDKKKHGAAAALLLGLLLLISAGTVAARIYLPLNAVPAESAPSAAPVSPPDIPLPAPSDAPVSPAEKPEETPGIPVDTTDYSGMLRISEVMSKNRATLLVDGIFPDYVELENCSGDVLSLSGWALSDKEGEPGWPLPPISMEPGAYLLITCGDSEGEYNADFSLSAGETVFLISPSGQILSPVTCSSNEADAAIQRQEDGSYTVSFWATPGYPNTVQGYLDFISSRRAEGPIVINEAMSANTLYAIQPDLGGKDWVELKNISQEAVSLSGWHLSDDPKDYALWTLPDRTLAPGETMLVYCSGDESNTAQNYIHANFSLNAANEHLYLAGPDGRLMDYVHLHDIPSNGSMGRMNGENGFFYFATPTPLKDNSGGVRRVSAQAVALTPDGAYNDVTGLAVELFSPGAVYYTTDGSVPTTSSPRYTEPIQLTKTSVVRALAVEDGALPSRVATFSYMLNENHTLPILSLVVDDLGAFNTLYRVGKKYVDVPANLALYDGDSSFNRQCSVSIKGWTSRDLPKKSVGVSFDGIYGGDLECDVFGNGITRYSSLSVRAGQDYTSSIFRNELFQELGLEMSPNMYVQYSKYCLLYLNGEYRGIYCLKEDYSRQYYASRNGIGKDSVTAMRTPVAVETDYFQEIVEYFRKHDLSVEENYQYICDRVDIDNLIDWCILEGYSCNTDLQGNARVFRSPETGNKWQFGAYDFDWAFYYAGSDFSVILNYTKYTNSGNQIPPLITRLLKHPDFRQRFLTRFAELNKTVLSNEHVLAKIDEFQALLEPEVRRNQERWGMTAEHWLNKVDELRAFITDNDWARHNVRKLDALLGLTKEEKALFD